MIYAHVLSRSSTTSDSDAIIPRQSDSRKKRRALNGPSLKFNYQLIQTNFTAVVCRYLLRNQLPCQHLNQNCSSSGMYRKPYPPS